MYLLADITNLPLKDDVIDAIVSLHTIYHVPENLQFVAFHETCRVLKPGSSAVVVYSWGNRSLLMNLTTLPFKVLGAILKRMQMLKKEYSETSEPKLYFHVHKYKYLKSQIRGFDFEVLVWRSVSVLFTKRYIYGWLFGKRILVLIYWLEDRFPHLFGRIGQYPLFVIKK